MRQQINVILNCQLFEMLQDRYPELLTSNQLETAFEEVHALLQEVTDGAESFSDKYRVLTFVTAFVNGINPRPKDVLVKRTIKILKECIKAELELLQKHLIYPSLFAPRPDQSASPSLYWNNDKYTKRDLIELVSALGASGAIVDSSGKPISYIQLIKLVSSKLNSPISDKYAYKERDYVTNIKHNSTAFLEKLVRSLENN